MEKKVFRIIPRIEKDNKPILFLPDLGYAPNGMIACYARVGEHSSAHIAYYRESTKPARDNAEAAELVQWYKRNRCEDNEDVRIISRLPRFGF